METIFQSIEILSKEKGIDPQIVLDAVKDAMLVAARKHFRTNEDYVADMDRRPARSRLYAVKKVVEAVEDPAHEMTLDEARRIDPEAEIGVGNPHPEDHRRAGPHFGADGQAGDFPEGARSRARDGIQGILRARRRTGELHGEAHGRSGLHAGSGQDRSAAAEERAVAPGELQRGRPRALRDQAGGQVEQEPGRDCFARGAGAGDAPVRTGSAGDLRQHGGRSRAARGKPASGPRSRCRAATATWTAWAPAWA